MLIPIVAALMGDTHGQTNPAESTNSPAAVRRQLLSGNTNVFRPDVATPTALPGSLAPAVVTHTNLPKAQPAIGVNANGAIPLQAPGAAVALPLPAPNAAVGPTAAPAGVAGQVGPAPAFPSFPTLPAPTLPAPGTVAAQPVIVPGPGGAATKADDTSLPEGGLDFKGATLEQVFEAYQEYSQRTILRPYALPAQGITIHSATPMTRKQAIQALDSVLALNGIVMLNQGELFVKAVPAAQAEKEGAAIDISKAADLPESEQFVTKVVTLKTAKPSEVAQVITAFSKSPSAVTPIDSNQTLVLRDYSSNIKRMLELIEKIDVIPEKDFKLEVIPIRYGKVTDIFATMNALISGGGGSGGGGFGATGVGGRSSGMSGSSMMNRGGRGMGGMGGMGSSGFNRGGYGGGGYGGGGYGGYSGGFSGGSIYPQQQGSAEQLSLMEKSVFPQQVAQPSAAAAQNSFQARLNSIVSKASAPDEEKVLENANIVPDERSNTLLIFANKRDMEMITNIVAKVDVLLAQVLIEAVILEVSLGDTLNYGVTAAQRAKQFTPAFQGAGASKPDSGPPLFGSLTNFPAGAPNGFSYFGKIGSSFDVAIQAVATDRKANVISRPRIQTSHAIPGDIFVGETRPYVTGFSDYSYGTSLSTRSTVQERTIGLTLFVTPFITPDGFVVMELSQQFDSYKGDITVENNPYPLVDSRMANSTLTVRNGDLIMMGGFITESHSKEKKGVPFLKDIPGLGALFRSTAQNASRTELIILMKATVLESPEQAAFVASQERTSLPGIREAEMVQAESDAKRTKKVNRKVQAREPKGF